MILIFLAVSSQMNLNYYMLEHIKHYINFMRIISRNCINRKYMIIILLTLFAFLIQ